MALLEADHSPTHTSMATVPMLRKPISLWRTGARAPVGAIPQVNRRLAAPTFKLDPMSEVDRSLANLRLSAFLLALNSTATPQR
jgi:hypothetical protein